MQKFLIDPDLTTDGNVIIDGQDARHMAKVLRLTPGSRVSLTNGNGKDFIGEIAAISREKVEISILEEAVSLTESGLHLTICSAMLKDKKMDGVVKTLVQLGVTSWIPFFSSRSVARPNSKQMARRRERWQTIARESLKQCRRSRLMEVASPMEFNEVLRLSGDSAVRIAFWEGSDRPLTVLAGESPKNRSDDKVILLIGPEGGFSREEIRDAESAGFSSYALGPRILRAETAAVTAAGLIQYLLGDLGNTGPLAP
ncbi:MAG: 16S rRNA (uracil(1498)-N(3))-methyltransferase [Desulfobacterales bacterium]|nr:16S rRNA (uracil(1498)-N(3))-methyltransferase [Desulfobacterales bacterium]